MLIVRNSDDDLNFYECNSEIDSSIFDDQEDGNELPIQIPSIII